MRELIDLTDKEAQNKLGKIGVIAGNGNFPIHLVKSLLQNKTPFVVMGIKNFVKNEVAQLAKDANCKYVEYFITDLVKTAKFFRKENVNTIIIIGGVNRKAIRFNNFTVFKAFFKLLFYKKKHDAIFRIIISEFEKRGFKVVGIQDAMPSLMPKTGVLTKTKPTVENMKDINFAINEYKNFGKTDIGQSLIILDRKIIGTEAMSGTDDLLKKCLALKNEKQGGIVVKLPKFEQEERIDVPAIGLETIKNISEAKLDGLVIASEYHTIIDEKEKLIEFADKNNIFISAVEL